MVYVYVGVAGIIGTWLRYGISLLLQPWSDQTGFPLGTLTVNLVGCFSLGWFSQWTLDKTHLSPHLRAGIRTGLIGSFTTFSTFSAETVHLFRQGLYGSSLAYVGASLFGGLGLVWLGTLLASRQRGKGNND